MSYKSPVSPELRRILEIAGTLGHHEEEEHALFGRVCTLMKQLEAFCAKQHEADVYGPISHQAKALCSKLEAHFNRYEDMSAEKKKEIENK